MFLQELSLPEKHAFLEIAHLVANANGIFDEREKKMIDSFSKEMGLHVEFTDLHESTLPSLISTFTNERTKKIVFIEALAVAFADGVYHEEQKEMINDIREGFGFSTEYYQQVKEWLIEFSDTYLRGVALINNGQQFSL